ncbi:SSI family serine proteinase inhibitor [Streptomyces sp. NBC_01465]|uniref:SSI family serine proteinase inhibitor n=1 Tax=Streptomyces sp. NBC_01465 TaxID=2903878 RepID=UPI002E37B7EF|nr:SSI family serine proteinase inhibitor [Streptomyces sp. NBC_01465]
MTRFRALCGGILAAGALLLSGSGVAQAQEARAYPGNWMYVAVMQGEEALGNVSGTLVRCPQGGGGHPHGKQACKELAAVGGDITRMKPRTGVMCPMIYQPVTAMAYGVWNGHRKVYSMTFSNPCVLKNATGSVFGLR